MKHAKPSIPDVICALMRTGETLSTLAVRIGVSDVSVWRWREDKVRPHKRDEKKLRALYLARCHAKATP